MNTMDDLLQQRIEQLGTGDALDDCLVGLSTEEAEAVRLVAEMRRESSAYEYQSVMAAQRVAVLRAAASHLPVPTPSATPPLAVRLSRLAFWRQPGMALSGRPRLGAGFAFGLTVLVLLAAWAGTSWWLAQLDERETAAPLTAPPAETVETTESGSSSSETAVLPPVTSPDDPAAFTTGVTPVPTYAAYVPVVSSALALNPQTAVLDAILGLVEVQTVDGSWTAVSHLTPLTAGQRVRTGALSSATLTFFDGSWARLGPESELDIETLDAPPPAEGIRTITLSQERGESQHDVVSRDDDSVYIVNTPAGTASVQGTQFQVIVQDGRVSQFIVTQGQVDVSSQGENVEVISGQASTVIADQPPTEPYLFISGEGEVSQTGPTWIIAGQTFQTDEHTHVLGNPQIGDLVRIEGFLRPDGVQVALRITLLHHAPENRFSFTGEVSSISDPVWAVAGQNVIVNAQTQVEDGIVVGSMVRVDGVIIPGGTLLAETIRLVVETPGLPFQFTGIVQTMDTAVWTISGQAIALNDDTVVEAGIVVGDQVLVRGWILPDDTWLAGSIARMPAENPSFDFTGHVQSLDPWRVSDILFETRDWTLIDEGITIGSRVRVSGPILPDGTWVAAEIQLLDNAPGHEITFVGRVNSIDPWVVSQMPLATNSATQIIGDVQIGDLVQVRATVQLDGVWLARTIRKLSPPDAHIIIIIEGPIESINGNILVVGGFTIEVSPGHPILNLLEEGDVVRVIGRLQPDGVVLALVIYNIFGSPPGDITVRVEGPITAIDGNLILVNGIWLWLDPTHPLLALLRVGDFVSAEGYFSNHGTMIVLIVVNIIIINVSEIPQNCYWHEAMGMGHWHCGMGMGTSDCHWHEAMGMNAGHWHCGMGMGMGMGMGNP
ncbi:MAG: FecR domain-containing protein [Anaerolineae bacterium]|nr:FecR domain-containing protein [Anaerolineae bacterium]